MHASPEQHVEGFTSIQMLLVLKKVSFYTGIGTNRQVCVPKNRKARIQVSGGNVETNVANILNFHYGNGNTFKKKKVLIISSEKKF